MNIGFVSSVEIGYTCLEHILNKGYKVTALFSVPEQMAVRTSGYVDFKPLARKADAPLYCPKVLNSVQTVARLKEHNIDLLIVCGWQRLLSTQILEVPAFGAVGFHSSLLPEYRGRAPVNWAIIQGEKRTGVTMFFCDEHADTGPIIGQKTFAISQKDTCKTIYEKSAKASCRLLDEHLPKVAKRTVKIQENSSQKHKFWPKRRPEDGKVDWQRNANDVHNWVRALTKPYPGAFTHRANGQKIMIWQSALSRSLRKASPGTVLDKRVDQDSQIRFDYLVACGKGNVWLKSQSEDLAVGEVLDA